MVQSRILNMCREFECLALMVGTSRSPPIAFIVGYLMMSRINNDLSFLENNFERGLFDLIGIKQETQE